MRNIRDIRRRIQSVRETGKVTRAMEMIASIKMRRAQQRMTLARPYADKIAEVLSYLAAERLDPEGIHPLLARRAARRVQFLLLTSDQGLAGGLNAGVHRAVARRIVDNGLSPTVVAVGRKGRDFAARSGLRIRAQFTGLGDRPGMAAVAPIAKAVMDDYIAGAADMVLLAYPSFVSTTSQRPVIETLLPVEPARGVRRPWHFIFEPDVSSVLAQLLPSYVEARVYAAVLETIASEQSARMVAMRKATDSANDLVRDLTLAYNKGRQDAITKELLDITGGARAVAR